MANLGNKRVMARNLSYYVERSGKNQKEIALAIGISPAALNGWINANKYPRIDMIEKLANYFGILKSDLIEEKTESHREMQQKNDILSDIILKLNSDDDFLFIVERLSKMDHQKISSLRTFLK